MVSNHYLKRFYNAANKVYFGNKLPKDTIVLYDSTLKKQVGCLDYYPGLATIIRIDKKVKDLSADFVALTLYHELCHLYLIVKYEEKAREMEHGPKFQNQMKRLSREGAFNEVW